MQCGAVNTINRDGKLIGYMHGLGFLDSLREAGFEPQDKDVVIFVPAVLPELWPWRFGGKCAISALINRTLAKAEKLARAGDAGESTYATSRQHSAPEIKGATC